MQEQLLQFIWQHQYFDKTELCTTAGVPVTILKTGYLNKNNGPDFKEAQIILDGLHWYGNIEIHVHSSDWWAHEHQYDVQYNNVVLHVVWQQDKAIFDTNGRPIPTIELKGRVGLLLLEKYRHLMKKNRTGIACADLFESVPNLKRNAMLHRTLSERLIRKAERILEDVEICEGDWVEALYRVLCKYMGFKLNEDGFSALSSALPYKILSKHKDQALQIEALLYGVSTLLPRVKTSDENKLRLYKEYEFLKHKYGLIPVQPLWNYSKIRPANAPEHRITQLARFVSKLNLIFDAVVSEHMHPHALTQHLVQLSTLADDNWLTKSSKIGTASVQTLIINVVVPFKAAWVLKEQQIDRLHVVAEWLEQMPVELNNITKKWQQLSWYAGNAFESQGQIELFQNYCTPKRCLQCIIGNQVLKS
jgi:hypothetical protein